MLFLSALFLSVIFKEFGCINISEQFIIKFQNINFCATTNKYITECFPKCVIM